jgi:uncharacterized membrane protein
MAPLAPTHPSRPYYGTPSPAAHSDEKRSVWLGALLGVGLMAGVDEIVFHQLLGWHHFYDRATPAIGLLSDGILHAFELLAIVVGFFGMLALRERKALHGRWARAGFFLGAGGFQLFDGIVDHKLLRVHQIRYGVPIWPYDLAWNLAAVALIGVGFALLARARKHALHA